MRSWDIGNSADCDVVVDSPMASGRHCRLTQSREGFFLEDLGSTNGTYVDGIRISSATRVAPGMAITLGQSASMPWPSEAATFIHIGRVAGNDIVLDDPRVSSRHARLIFVDGCNPAIEDLGSSNGTFLNSADNRVTRLIRLSSADTVYFGSLAVPAARLLAARVEPVAPIPVPSPSNAAEPRTELIEHEQIDAMPRIAPIDRSPGTMPVERMPAASFLEGMLWHLAALAQAPVLAISIVLILKRQSVAAGAAANWASVGQAIASASFALALCAVWLGCSFALAEVASGRWPGRRDEFDGVSFFNSLGSRIGVLVLGCAVGCGLLLTIVHAGSGFRGSRLAMWALLVLASIVGLMLGLLVSAWLRNWRAVALILIMIFVLMAALGGRFLPLSGRSLPIRMVAAALPVRWAFEAILLLESPSHPAPVNPDNALITPDRDLAEAYFAADSTRMGPYADAMALGFMLIGVASAVALTLAIPTTKSAVGALPWQ
jgi:pSer/pThr/pTyr-binding forkhead associated (FHA) protein